MEQDVAHWELLSEVHDRLLSGCACRLSAPDEWLSLLKRTEYAQDQASTLCVLSTIQFMCEIAHESRMLGKLCPSLWSNILTLQSELVIKSLHTFCILPQCKFRIYCGIQCMAAVANSSAEAWNSVMTLLEERADGFQTISTKQREIYFQLISRLLQNVVEDTHPLGKLTVTCKSATSGSFGHSSGAPKRDIADVVRKWWNAIWSEGLRGAPYTYLQAMLSLWLRILEDCQDMETFHELSAAWIIDTVTDACPLLSNMCLQVCDKGLQSVATDPIVDVSPCVLQLAKTLISSVEGGWLNRIQYRTEFCGFGGTVLQGRSQSEQGDENVITGDARMLRRTLLAVFKASVVHLQQGGASVPTVLHQTFQWMHLRTNKLNWTKERIIVELFVEQDDQLLECLHALLLLHCAHENDKSSKSHKGDNPVPDPHIMLLLFLHSLCNDHSALVDLLTSDETCALLYFVRYLKTAISNWTAFVGAHTNCSNVPDASSSMPNQFCLDDTMAVLIRLRLKLEKMFRQGLVPFNVRPLLRLLQKCECLYEGTEL
ncbi:uncharacterized protein LOC135371285 [Ornithodoros turicata]|uniref:uncharacterized protein LOC135371285 n=1 Tax=Ornithodoros turicata TaxID=34597 RepID=UPI003138CE85